jgi:hypothetical protein
MPSTKRRLALSGTRCRHRTSWLGVPETSYWFFNLDYRPDWNRLLSRHRSKLPDVVEWAVFGSKPGSVSFIAYDKDTDGDVVSLETLPLADWQWRS